MKNNQLKSGPLFKAVIFATKAITFTASSVLAGLAANGVTPHLH